MKRREFLGAAATLFLFPGSASTQGKVRRVGYLSAGAPITDDSPTSGPVISGLKRLGWIEGSTILFERRAANQELSRLPSLVSELVAERVEAILTSGFPAVAACKGASVPAIASGAGDVVALGLVDSFRHPGGNITGISDLAGELAPKRLSLLKEMAPSMRKVTLLWNGEDRAMGQRYQLSAASASSLDLTVRSLPVREPHDFDIAFSNMERDPPDAGFMVVDGLTGSNRERVIQFAAAHRIPFMYEGDFIVRDGGLLSYGPDLAEVGERQASLLDKILHGANAGDLPFERPTLFTLAVNVKTAKALGLVIPPTILARADEVVE
ncbi:ABC transporter substrate-binding protein [Bradyrhizobium sp. Gha]|uniref:ABC transporter substrate-binding protein n=1 Tax=Bradyrhizobium sp. Gha TaxID=1855318 RepID=UPI0015A5F1A3|nr:ABC transporter substrate-binding protein [Bradyrhizobium sp. Gha]